MKDNLIDFNKFKEEKNKKSEEEYNLELFQNVITKSQEELTDGEKYVYAQIKLLYHFLEFICYHYTRNYINFFIKPYRKYILYSIC